MQSFFLESPLLLGASGCLIVSLAVFLWIQTAHRAALYGAFAALAATIVLVLLSIQIETPREQIEKTIQEVADAVENNRVEEVLEYLHPGAVVGRRHVEQEMPRYKFTEARVTRMHSIAVNHATNPPTAIAEFNVIVDVSAHGQSARVPRFVRAYFTYSDGKWLVNDYEYDNATAGFRDRR